MTATRTTLLLDLFDCMLAARSSADELFALARDKDATHPDEAYTLRSIARMHRVNVLKMEGQLAALHASTSRFVDDEPYEARTGQQG